MFVALLHANSQMKEENLLLHDHELHTWSCDHHAWSCDFQYFHARPRNAIWILSMQLKFSNETISKPLNHTFPVVILRGQALFLELQVQYSLNILHTIMNY